LRKPAGFFVVAFREVDALSRRHRGAGARRTNVRAGVGIIGTGTTGHTRASTTTDPVEARTTSATVTTSTAVTCGHTT
jgi:hypothetical protein